MYVEGNPVTRVDPSGHCQRPDGTWDLFKWPWFGPCDPEDQPPTTPPISTPSPIPSPTPTPCPTPTPTPVPTMTIFFGGSGGDTAFPGPDPFGPTKVWAESATSANEVISFPGGSNGVGKMKQANAVDINAYKDANLILIGYSAGGDAALIFADKYRKYQQVNNGKGKITDIAVLGGTMTGNMTDSGTLAERWEVVLNNLSMWGTDIYILDDMAGGGGDASGYSVPSGATGTFYFDLRLDQEHWQGGYPGTGTNNSITFKDYVFSWFSSY